MLDEMKGAGRSKQSGVADTVGGVSGFSDSSSRNLSPSSKQKKRRRVVESDSESSDYSSETTHKLHKRSAVYKGAYVEAKEFETEKRASSGLDVFEFDEYDGFDDVIRPRKDANGGKYRWNSYRQNTNQMKSGNDGSSRPTYEAKTPLEMEDDDFDLPLSVLSKKYRSSSDQPMRLQGKTGVLKVMVNKNKHTSVSHRSYDKKEAEDQKEPKPKVEHKKKLDKNGDHRDGKRIRSEDTKRKEKGGVKSLKQNVEKSNSRVESVKKLENVKKVKEKESMVKHGSGTEKQILREKIKNMLLVAGWSIDYRPRKKKNYLDAIYTNPTGTAYWSIIKAYEVLQKEEEYNTEETENFTPLPVEILGKLARQTQKKTEKELKTKRKDEVNSRNAKRGMEDTELKDSHGRRKSRCTLLVRDSNKVLENDGISPSYSGKRTILAWLIDSGVVDMNEHVEYMNARRTRILKKGWITRDGIRCSCCSKILPVLKFEQHSGSNVCNPFLNMFLKSGKSLMQCRIDAWDKVGELEKKGFYSVDVGDDANDDTCSVCGDGGDLMCCDTCPSTFHQSCLDIEMLPEGDWLCPNCSCKYCGMEDGGVTEASLHTCCFCYKKYHESCRQGIDVKPHEHNLSFCGQKCHEVYIPLQKLIGVKHELDSGFSWSLIHRSDSDSFTDGEVSQRMELECNSILAVAMSVMDECFLPFTDRRSGTNLIRNVVFNCGSNLSRLNYSGFYTAILEREEEVICAASIRFHGTQLAEMPFIGTRHIYRRQGMCRLLLSAIESALSALQVEKLIIPAVAEHMNTWTDVFGFQPLEESHKQELKSMNMLVFPKTDMLQKPLLKQDNKTIKVDGVSALSKKPELISSNSDKNGTTDSGFQESGVPMDDGCSLDASKETLPINPPVKDESPCEPELQQPGKESDSDSIHSHSNSKVDEIDVQNGNGSNPLPAQVHDDDIPFPCESHEQVPAAPSSEPKLQQSGKESDSVHSHSDSKAIEISVRNGNETNPLLTHVHDPSHDSIQLSKKESFSSMDAQIEGNNTIELDDDSGVPKNKKSELIPCNVADIDSGSQECVVSLDDGFGCCLDTTTRSKKTLPLNSPVKVEDSDSDSKVHEIDVQNGNRTNSKEEDSCGSEMNNNRKEKERAVSSDSEAAVDCNDPLHYSVMEVDECSALSIQQELISSNVTEAEVNYKTAITDNIVSSEIPDKITQLQLPGMESVSIHSHSESKLNEIAMQNDNETDPTGNNTIEVDDGSALELISSNVADTGITNSGSQDASKDTLSLNSPIIKDDDILVPVSACKLEFSNVEEYTRDQIPPKITKDSRKEYDSIRSHSDSKVDEVTVQNGNGTNPLPTQVHDFSHDAILSEKEYSSCVDVQTTNSMVLEINRKEKERGIPGAVFDSEDANNSSSNIMEVDDVGPQTKKQADFSEKNGTTDSGSQESCEGKESDPIHSHSHSDSDEIDVLYAIPSDIPPCESHEQVPAASFSGPKLQLPENESDSIHSHSNSNDALIRHGVTNPLPAQVHDAIPSDYDIPFKSHEQVPDAPPFSEPKLQHPGEESDSIHSHSDSKVDEIDVQNPLPGQLHGDIPCELHELVPATPNEPKLQHPRKESDSIHSHSDSKVDDIDVLNGHGNPEKETVQDNSQFFEGKEGSYESEMNRKEKERGIPGAVSDSEAGKETI